MVRENELLFTENPMKGLQPSKETIPGVTAAAPWATLVEIKMLQFLKLLEILEKALLLFTLFPLLPSTWGWFTENSKAQGDQI